MFTIIMQQSLIIILIRVKAKCILPINAEAIVFNPEMFQLKAHADYKVTHVLNINPIYHFSMQLDLHSYKQLATEVLFQNT